MKNMLIVIMLVFGIAMFVLGVMLMIISEQIVRSIQLCWSPECSKEFIGMLWKSLTYLLIGVIDMLVGALIIAEVTAHIDDP